jgi:thiosulfate/3-mercaptopyruvate sulfurtransferase
MDDETPPEVLASPGWLQDHLQDPRVRVVEVGTMDPPAYADRHIPGAAFWPWKESLWDRQRREFVAPDSFAALLGRSGVTPATTLVLYSRELQFATYALWTCVLRGHPRVMLLDGGFTSWQAAGRPLSGDPPNWTVTDYPVRAPDESGRIRRDDVLAGLHNPDRVLLDARSPEEYAGLRVMPGDGFDHGAERKGRIPGARHLHYRELLHDDDTFRAPETLHEIFASRGATPEKEIVAYCRLSHRATLLWFAARQLLGYPRVRSYDGSWTEWGSMVGMPVETA